LMPEFLYCILSVILVQAGRAGWQLDNDQVLFLSCHAIE
jgi:hypothetical protein